MSKGRLEAFSDGVLAIVLTITVLKLTPPAGFDAASLKAFGSLVLAYIVGYTFVGIQWINHHRLFDPLELVTPKIMWKNLNWLFWMTLLPFAIEWTGSKPIESIPATVFCAILLISTLSFNELQREILRDMCSSSSDAREIQSQNTGALTVGITAAGTLMALFYPAVSFTVFLLYGGVRILRDLLSRKKRV